MLILLYYRIIFFFLLKAHLWKIRAIFELVPRAVIHRSRALSRPDIFLSLHTNSFSVFFNFYCFISQSVVRENLAHPEPLISDTSQKAPGSFCFCFFWFYYDSQIKCWLTNLLQLTVTAYNTYNTMTTYNKPSTPLTSFVLSVGDVMA